MNITQCPKCGHQRGPLDDPEIPDIQCPACGIYYFKYLNQKSRLPTPQVSPPTAPAGSKNRISITAAQAKTEAGAQLLKLCQEVTGDGQLSDEEIAAIRHWLVENSTVELPAVAFLSAAVSDYFNPDSSNFCYRKPLYSAIEAVLPVSERKQATDKRREIEAAEKNRVREEKKQQAQQEKRRKKEARERNRPILHANFMTAGCKYENRQDIIDRYVDIGDPAVLTRDKANQFSPFAVKVMTQSGRQIGFVPEVYAEDIAQALDENAKYDAIFTKILGYDFSIPVVDVKFFRQDADKGGKPVHQPPKKTFLAGYIALGLAALIIINMIDAKQNAADNAKTYADRLAQQDADCKKNLKCSAEKNISAVAGPCGRAVFKLSKYQAEWTNATTEPRLSRYRWHDQARGTITFIGDKIKFQTDFGAWQNIIYECDFDPKFNKIFAVRAAPGRI
jgi:hypothetical protein